jgi:hypothetical protein
MSLPAIPEGAGPPALPPGMCPLCGADTDPGQEYCLECGERLVAAPVFTGEAVAQMLPFTRRSWFWPAVVSFLVGGTALTVAFALGILHKPTPVQNFTTPFITVSVSRTTTAPTAPVVTPQTTPTKTPTPTTPRSNTLSEWPSSRSSGYTIVLASLPAGGGRAQAVALARRALAAGLTQVGILDSKRFASLHPGYFVVFSGIFDSASAAGAALSQAHANGFSAAYERQVSR